MSHWARIILWALACVCLLPAGVAQSVPTTFARHKWDVFVERDIRADGMDRMHFIDVLTGTVTQAETLGERYTPLGDGVLYYDPLLQQVMQATPDGQVRLHPFIAMGTARRVDWIVSADGERIAWTLTEGDGEMLTTQTFIAGADGSGLRQVQQDGPRNSVRVLPVTFNRDATALYMDVHPDGLSRFMPYTQYAGLFELNLLSGEVRSVPGENLCFCGAGFSRTALMRLAVTPEGYAVQVYDLLSGRRRGVIPPLSGGNWTLAGGVLVAPDGTQAVYALSQIENFGATNQSVRTVFALVDLLTLTQRALTEPILTYVTPVRWTEDNSAILFTSPQQSGTWKVAVADGALTLVADATFIGTLVD